MKKYLPTIISLALLLIASFLYYNFAPKPDIGPSEAILTIDFGETKRSFAGETIEGMTVYDVLIVSSEAGGFDFEFENGFLERIDQFEQNDKKWNLYFNRKKTEEDLREILIQAGDKVELKFE